MTNSKQQITVWASTALAARIAELAYQRRTTVSDILREQLDALMKIDKHTLAGLRQPLGRNYDKPIVANVDRKMWAKCVEKARIAGISISEFVRANIEKELEKYEL